LLFIDGTDPFDYSSDAEVDGLPVSPSQLEHMLDTGSVGADLLVNGHLAGHWDFTGHGSLGASGGGFWLPRIETSTSLDFGGPSTGSGVYDDDGPIEGGGMSSVMDLAHFTFSTNTTISVTWQFASMQGGTPQNSVVLIPGNLRNRVAARVNDQNSGCADFMRQIIANAAKIDGKAFDYTGDLMNLFDRVQNGGGFNLRAQKDKGNADLDSHGKPIVYIKPVTAANDPRRIDNVQTNYAGTALGEIMHTPRTMGCILIAPWQLP